MKAGYASGLARVHACRAKRLLPGHGGHVSFSFPLKLLRIGLLVKSDAVWHPFCIAGGVLSMPELLRRLALAVRCGTLAPAVRGLSSGSSREKLAFPPLVAKLALLERMNGAWDCFAQGIA